MKQVLDAAGIRTPRHAPRDDRGRCREAAERIGYPLIVKPIAGAGSADTYRFDDGAGARARARRAPARRTRSPSRSSSTARSSPSTRSAPTGRSYFEQRLWYRPAAARSRAARVDQPAVDRAARPRRARPRRRPRDGRTRCSRALGFSTGFTHMEWYRKADGEVVFGEIGAPPAGRALGRPDELLHRHRPLRRLGRGGRPRPDAASSSAGTTSAASSSARRRRAGSRASTGWTRCSPSSATASSAVDLLPVGAPRRDWRSTVVGDGYVVVRHPDLQRVVEMTDRFAAEVQMYAS